ncbi:hypothetical protein MCOR27_003074 [Pyricularia oryzae]|uniref:Uncharacterized protein n=1 Tax=Pyricularia oryzae TaxID=318829 RepID=A0A4P7N4V5_PYROR|nr:hypothetical protein MCOR27_003074 [Pyricularia oryzae]KAI6326474.1 hypothetical protein MCOR29_003429 [Pyricularia oryzae]KAI6361056.1 hypothetical protein MCOR32_008813 [Pyricularia oryzae]KAI6433833.1 hypothetical protein MCOR24_001072 [Pyricularia oryzae]KAI6471511.1 hypothetical protein MCOR15_000887 [Pyricularia oryzae]
MARHNGGFNNQHQANGNNTNNNNRQWMNNNNDNNTSNNNKNNNRQQRNANGVNNNNNRNRNNNNGPRNQSNQPTKSAKPCRYGLQCTKMANGSCPFGHPNSGNVNHIKNSGLGNHGVRNNEGLGTTQPWDFGEFNPIPHTFDSHINQGQPGNKLMLEYVEAFGTRPSCDRYPSGVFLDQDGDVIMCDCTSRVITAPCFADWYYRSWESQRQLRRDHEQLVQELSDYKLNHPSSWSKEEAFQRMSVELRSYVADKYVQHMNAEELERKRKPGIWG